jgi:hypothetical protein
LERQQIIETLMAQHAEQGVDATINLWQSLATEIIAIIGEGGFSALYTRSVFITQETFHWLTASAPPAQRFDELKTCLQAQPPTLARIGNSVLLITFTDILATLIGEQLTARILSSAWDIGALDRINKELKKK